MKQKNDFNAFQMSDCASRKGLVCKETTKTAMAGREANKEIAYQGQPVVYTLTPRFSNPSKP